ncbi:type I-E CRISPR-associated protein Cse2/CasB [Peptococcus niger]|uniref:CRISPR system Cascade subunit CasB n=1 Tax=Peptococcus niger TaxID=2741 RepID=A0A1G6YB34_PEPNI|nr:type I-E CRISPR-associated protein Cse2/CasB [Peptococcus niger]SDD87203.1 CRISPR system Cascade subunit CasB [Peptococcus niger]
MSEDKKDRPTVSAVTAAVLHQLVPLLKIPAGRAALASLRQSVGSSASAAVGILPFVYAQMPEDFIGSGADLSHEEKAIIHTLQLFALHQQGSSTCVWSGADEETSDVRPASNMGDALKALRQGNNKLAVDRRFNALITATTYDELLHHLRQMIRLLRAKTNVTVDYPQLAKDLYWFSRGYEESLRLNWARHYYRFDKKGQDQDA